MQYPTNSKRSTQTFKRMAVLALGTLAVLPALAADPAPANDAKARYERDRAVCMTGKSNQDQATCLKEAGAALDEARRGELNDGGAAYRKNALIRCNALPAKDQPDCVARIEGDAKTSGTARDGGIIRERTTREVNGVAVPAVQK